MKDINNLLPIGTLLRNGTYRIERPLGSGGFGNTYLVRHCGLDAMMVVKEFFMKGINLRGTDNTVTVSVPDNRATYESQRDKFKKEAQRLWRLKSDHIVGVHDIFEENGTVYYVMDFIEGESLEDHIRRQDAPMQEHEVRDIMDQLLDALSVIHGNIPTPIFHLDIKPGNILMSKEGRVVLIDFGASKQLSADREGVTSTMITYTRGYAPTEQMDGKPERIGAWTDLYALGATLYKLLTKNVPPDPSEISEETVDAFHFPSSVSAQIQKLIMWLMQPNRRKRPQSVAEVREFLNNSQPGIHTDDTDDERTIIGTKTPGRLRVSKSDQKSAAEPTAKSESESWWKRHIALLGVGIAIATGIVLILSTIIKKHSSVEDFLESGKSEDISSIVTFTVKGVEFDMVRVEGGTFQMGATSEQGTDAYDDEKPAHSVTLSSYYIGETEVTQELWLAVMGSNPSNFKGTSRPVEKVSWDDCKTFISKLNSLTGKDFRLPTEAEWEYAARGGNKSKGYKYSGSNTVGNVAWYGNSRDGTHPVKTKSPNELGIYDMSGNVWEWCQDWKGDYNSSPQTNPTGPSSGSDRVLRGGGWNDETRDCRVSLRGRNTPDFHFHSLGLRLAL